MIFFKKVFIIKTFILYIHIPYHICYKALVYELVHEEIGCYDYELSNQLRGWHQRTVKIIGIFN